MLPQAIHVGGKARLDHPVPVVEGLSAWVQVRQDFRFDERLLRADVADRPVPYRPTACRGSLPGACSGCLQRQVCLFNMESHTRRVMFP